jgi:hypothetical protein
VTKTVTLLGVSRATVLRLCRLLESWEDNISEEEQWVKINTDRKRSSSIEKDCFRKSQNYCSIMQLGSRTECSS